MRNANSVRHLITHIRIGITTHIHTHTDITTPTALIGGNEWV